MSDQAVFCQNDHPIGESFLQKNSLVIHILLEMIQKNCTSFMYDSLWYLVQFFDTLYISHNFGQFIELALDALSL
jgi:hypothetical protein